MVFCSKTRRLWTRNPAARRRRRAVAAFSIASLISVSCEPLLLIAAFVVIEKVLVDRLAAAEALVDAVPEADAVLAKLPAEVDFDAAEQRGEVDETGVEIFDQAAVLLDSLDQV